MCMRAAQCSECVVFASFFWWAVFAALLSVGAMYGCTRHLHYATYQLGRSLWHVGLIFIDYNSINTQQVRVVLGLEGSWREL